MPYFDLIVIGAGPGGYVAAIKAAQLGLKTAVIECDQVGGTCLNRGCIPTKTFAHTAGLMHEIQSCEKIGINVENASCDIATLYARKDEVISSLRAGVENLMKANNIVIIRGKGKIIEAGKVSVGDEIYSCSKILIATGSTPSKPPIPGSSLPNVITSDDLLATDEYFYKKIIILGGGVIGVEFATIYNSLGCDVTIVEAEKNILPYFDREISQNLSMILKKRGVKIITNALVEKIEEENGLLCHFASNGTNETISADGILLATGRKANTDGLLAEKVDLKIERGSIPVNSSFETCVKGIYAIGDVITGSIQLAHVASAQGINAVSGMCDVALPIDLSVVPSCIYTNPEIATVGIDDKQAKIDGINVKTGKYIMSGNGKSIISDADRGFIKVLINADTDKIIGAQMMCNRATDMISEIAMAIVNGFTSSQLESVIHPHPTFSEGISEAIEAASGHSIHTMPSQVRKN